VQEAGRKDPAGLGMQELPPRRARAAWRWIDSRGVQDLPHGGWRDGHAEFRQSAVDATVSPQRIFLRQAGDAGGRRRAAGPALVARVVFSRCQFSVPGQQRRWRDGEDFGPAPARDESCQRGEPHPVGWLVPDPGGVAAQHRVFVPEHQQLSLLRPLPAEHQDSEAEYPAN
jgi:hypothetical protein